ncbi:TspO/MBR family protein [Aestuariivirga litoralis]|uniref:TspO/MBR family protein n=1 Tax=Aestuariivirga litoralis TaxID=2650924 RepID=UPI0018C5155C|nr:TspO/MBR family protein [Aestuariivirga litoralis]MBG1232669.1 tryptophan-rich sensory protein [Aestuariivirga litoralis]
MNKQDWIALLGFVFMCLAVGGISGYFTAAGVGEWFDGLRKPFFNPPKWVFGPVWTLLYLMMGVAAFLVWRQVGFWHLAIGLFFVQLALNFAWSFIFFSAHRIGVALTDIILLWLAIVATIFVFAPLSAAAAWLLAPYLLWVTFASLLNASIWRLNPAQ